MTDADSSETEFLVDPDDCPCRVDAWLAAQCENLSRSRIQTLIHAGAVRIDGRPIKPRLELKGGERVRALLPEATDARPEPEAIPLTILYEDDCMLVVDKPAGLVVHPGAGVGGGTLANALLARGGPLSAVGGPQRPGIVHRLDRLTSGCLAVAKTDAAHAALATQLADRTMHRGYETWVLGEPEGLSGTVDAPLGRSAQNRTRVAVRQGGRAAVTHWRVVLRGPGITRLECELETGRTHQIRVHLAWRGYPVLGDPEYGPSARDARVAVTPGLPKVVQALSRLQRQMLHARRLTFTHPETGEPKTVEAPLPPDFAAFDEALAPYSAPPAPGAP